MQFGAREHGGARGDGIELVGQGASVATAERENVGTICDAEQLPGRPRRFWAAARHLTRALLPLRGTERLDLKRLRGRSLGGPAAPPGLRGQDRRRAPARYFRVNRHSRRPCVGRTGQHHHAEAFPGKQPGRVSGVNAHLLGAQRAGPSLQGEPDRGDAESRPGLARDRGEAELFADQSPQARRHARDDQPGPGGSGHVAQAGAERGRRNRSHIEPGRPRRAARPPGGRLEQAAAGYGEIMDFRGIVCAGIPAGHADDRDGSALIQETVHCPPAQEWLAGLFSNE
jgi:hypothetical protein